MDSELGSWAFIITINRKILELFLSPNFPSYFPLFLRIDSSERKERDTLSQSSTNLQTFWQSFKIFKVFWQIFKVFWQIFKIFKKVFKFPRIFLNFFKLFLLFLNLFITILNLFIEILNLFMKLIFYFTQISHTILF